MSGAGEEGTKKLTKNYKKDTPGEQSYMAWKKRKVEERVAVQQDDGDDEAAKHFVMQVRKAVTLRGKRPVRFADGSTHHVTPHEAQKFLGHYTQLRPMDKAKVQHHVSKSLSHFKGLVSKLKEETVNEITQRTGDYKTVKVRLPDGRVTMRRVRRPLQVQTQEKLDPSMGAGKYIRDFAKSDAPQFKGKSKAKRRKMALAAYYSDKNEDVQIDENVKDTHEVQDIHVQHIKDGKDKSYHKKNTYAKVKHRDTGKHSIVSLSDSGKINHFLHSGSSNHIRQKWKTVKTRSPNITMNGYPDGRTKVHYEAYNKGSTAFQRLQKFDQSRVAAGKKSMFQTDDEAEKKRKAEFEKHMKAGLARLKNENVAVKAARERIRREKEADKRRHDAMLDRARLNDTRRKNRGM